MFVHVFADFREVDEAWKVMSMQLCPSFCMQPSSSGANVPHISCIALEACGNCLEDVTWVSDRSCDRLILYTVQPRATLRMVMKLVPGRSWQSLLAGLLLSAIIARLSSQVVQMTGDSCSFSILSHLPLQLCVRSDETPLVHPDCGRERRLSGTRCTFSTYHAADNTL